MEAPVHSGVRVCTVLCCIPGAPYSSASHSHSHWEAVHAGLAVRIKWAQATVAECSVCKQNSLFARTPALHETCCPARSCLWTIQGALALSELQASSIWMYFWLSWQSLSLKCCLHTAAFTECSYFARTCRNRLGSCCTNASIPTGQPCIVLTQQLKHQTRQRLWV